MSVFFDESDLRSLSDWRAAIAGGGSLRALLTTRLARLEAQSPREVWIRRIEKDELEGRITELESSASSFASLSELLSALPLYGVPFAVKDNIDVAGIATTAACPAFSRVPSRTATVVQRLLDAGAVLFGKTNLDQFATGLVGARSPYGAPSSVFSRAHVSGGSSSGSAVAVARADVVFSLGTDTAGSGRIPAGFNNIVGFKPTPGRVSTAGVLPACRTLDCVSVFAGNVADASTILATIEGPDPLDDYSSFRPGRVAWASAPRVIVPKGFRFSAEPAYGQQWEQALAQIDSIAHCVQPRSFDDLFEVAAQLYQGPWVAERYAVVKPLLETQPHAFDPTVAAVIAKARQFDAVDAFNAHYWLENARRRLAGLWDECDVLMVPTAPRHPTHEALAADPIGVNAQLGTFTNFVNLLGWCALSLPAGFLADGRPFGVTFIARGGDDAALARWALQWERLLGIGAGVRRTVSAPAQATSEDYPGPAHEPTMAIAAVGAHLSGLPLNWQLTERRAVLRSTTRTAPAYRLYALPGTTPPKPGMLRVGEGGCSIELEIWDVPSSEVGSFLALIPAPLGLGSIELADGSRVHGFLCEAAALNGATDISAHGGWRSYLASLRASDLTLAALPGANSCALTSSPTP